MAAKIPVMGTFVGAEVVRGCDWRWKDQDGEQGCWGGWSFAHSTKLIDVLQVVVEILVMLPIFIIGRSHHFIV